MERRPKGEGSSSPGEDSSSSSSIDALTVIDSIKAIAASNARADIDNEKSLLLFLKSWWSRTYNRPLKDPLLESYTLEELLYEFYDRVERKAADEERFERDSDKMEEDKDRATLDWAEQEERKELEALKAEAAKSTTEAKPDPTTDPANVAWMEEQIRAAKAVHGETFGDDIDEKFDG